MKYRYFIGALIFMLLLPLIVFASHPVTLFKSQEYGFKFVTTKKCKKFLNVTQIEGGAVGDNALARFDINLPLAKEWSSILYEYIVMTRVAYNAISDEEIPGKPRIKKKLRNGFLLTAYDPQDWPLVSDLPQKCFVKVKLLPLPKSPQFDSMDKYVDLVLNSSTNSKYKTAKPSGFERAKFGGQGEGINVAPDGVSASIFIVAKSDWDVGNLEDIETFYLEVVGPSPCWTEPNCNEPNTVDFYGPFKGKLRQLVQ